MSVSYRSRRVGPLPAFVVEGVRVPRDLHSFPTRRSSDLGQLSARLARGLGRRSERVTQRLDRTLDRLGSAVTLRLERQRHRLSAVSGRLDALSPLRILARGYALARDAEGRVLKRIAQFAPGRAFRLRVSDGEVAARATGDES